MNINSRAYRTLHPRGKSYRRKAMVAGQQLSSQRQHAASLEPVTATAESQLTNHQRHVMRRKARELAHKALMDRKAELEASVV
jgi:hypothetical protein